MSNCRIVKDVQGSVIKVLDSQNRESKLFNDIVKIPHIEGTEQAIEVYDEILKANKGEEGVYSIQSGGVEYKSFKEALENTEDSNIQLVSNNTVIATFPSTKDESTKGGVINSLIVNNVIRQEKVVVDGKTYFQPTGDSIQEEKLTLEFLKGTINTMLPKRNYKIKDGLLEINNEKLEPSKEGSLHRTISDKIFEYFNKGKTVTSEKVNEKNLRASLFQLLNDMGVSLTTMKEYQKRFKSKNEGLNVSAEALADIANRVVAYKEGMLTTENLTEEVMHFIVETFTQEEIDGYTDFIRNSEEYREHFEAYNKAYKGDQRLVDKEILGKILKNITLEKLQGSTQPFLQRLWNRIQEFFNNIKVESKQRDDLKKLNTLVDKYVFQKNNKLTEDSLSKSKEISVLYSLSDQLDSSKGSFEKVFESLSDLKEFKPYLQELRQKKSFENIASSQVLNTVSSFIEMSNRLIETTESALEISKNTDSALSGQNLSILENLDNEIRSTLDSLKVEIKESKEYKLTPAEKNALIDRLEGTSTRISELRAENDRLGEAHVNRIVDEVLQGYGELEGEYFREHVRKVIKGEIEDTNLVFSYFGQLHNAHNPILNLIHRKLWDMHMESKQEFLKIISPFLEASSKNPSLQKEFAKLWKNGYLISEDNMYEFEKDLLKADMEAFSKISGETFKDTEEFSKKRMKGELKELSFNEKGEYFKLLSEKRKPLVEQMMKEEYYTKLYEKFETLKVSSSTQAFLKQMSSQRGAIKSRATKIVKDSEGNNVKRVVLTPQDKLDLNSISKIRKAKKSVYSEVGIVKPGLRILTEQPQGDYLEVSDGIFLVKDFSDKTLTEQDKSIAEISYDLNKLDLEYSEELKNKDTIKAPLISFVSYINSLGLQSNSELVDVIKNNINISLSKNFYDTIEGESILEKGVLENLNPTKINSVDRLRKLYFQRKSILSRYRSTISPFEIDKLTDSDQRDIQDISKEISSIMRGLKLPESGGESSNKATNEAYRKELINKNIEEGTRDELEFLTKGGHTNVDRVKALEEAIRKDRYKLPLTSSEKRMLDKYEAPTELESKLKIARDYIQPYYLRYVTEGYKSIEQRVDAGENIFTILNEINESPYFDLRLDYSFDTEANPMKNPNYKDDFLGGVIQPKKGEYTNKEFQQLFGINSKGEATKNKELFEYRKLWLETMKNITEKFNEPNHNLFKAIQISATNTEKLHKLFGKKDKVDNLKEMFYDTFAYRVDDIAYGERESDFTRKLPKYYFRDLENKSDVSTDYTYALTQFAARASQYAAKKNVVSDIDALYDTLLKSKRHAKSKDLNNALKMAKSYIDDALYGKIEAKPFKLNVPGLDNPIDLTKAMRVFMKYVSIKNLGFGPIVPATSYFTGKLSLMVEKIIGERINKESYKLASKEYRKLRGQGVSKALDFHDDSKLFHIGQVFGTFDISEKARNAKYGKFKRTWGKVPMGLHTVANYEIVSKITLTVLFNNKIVGDKIQNKAEFIREGLIKGEKRSDLESKWKDNEDSIYNYTTFDKNGMTFNKEAYDILGKEYLDNKKASFITDVRNEVSRIDMTIPNEMRVPAQRNALLSTIMQHKGFLTILGEARLKQKNLNLATGQLEEGHYRTLGRFITDFFNTKGNLKERSKELYESLKPPKRADYNNDKDFNEAFLEYELNLRNMKRIGIELGALMTFALLVVGAISLTEDEEDENYFYALSNYMLMRTLNESSSAYSAGIFGDVAETVESPFVAYQSAKQIKSITDVFDGEEVKTGRYKGLTKRERYLTRNIPGAKAMYDMWEAENISSARNVYELYRKDNLDMYTLGITSILGED